MSELEPPLADESRRVLALMPHPDDMEILCAGTLIRLREAGCEIHVATMTPGDKGSAELDREAIAEIRREEARRGAETIGAASYTCLEFADCEIVFDNESRRRVASFLRTIDPWVVITTSPDDYMFDHIITSQLVRDACFNAPMRNYTADGIAIAGVPYLYYTDTIGGVDDQGFPTGIRYIVDISKQIKLKSRALACHESQRQWLEKHHGIDDYIRSMREWSNRLGIMIRVGFGEGFAQHRGHAYPADGAPMELVRGRRVAMDYEEMMNDEEGEYLG